jgi:uncharacterized BrkB/YihY/UPF0761 family membrane protein
MEGEGSPPATHDEPAHDEQAHDEAGRVARTTLRLKGEQARVRRLISDTQQRLERARPRSPVVDAAFRAVDRDVETGGVVLAGAVAFRVFLFLVPYVFVAVVGFGVAADAAGRDASDLARDGGIGGLVAKSISGASDLSGVARFTALVVGLFALLLGTRALYKVLRIVYGLIWGVPAGKPKSQAKAVLAVLGLATGGFLFVGLLDQIGERSLPFKIGALLISSLVPFMLALIANITLPRQPTRWPDLVPGAIVLTIGVLGLHVITVVWIAHELESKTDTYGAIGAALALLLWSYLLGRLITASAVVNASLWQRREERRERRAARAQMHHTSAHDHRREGPDERSDDERRHRG